MQLEQVRVEALANNLANVNSNGFQQVLTTAQQLAGTPRDAARPEEPATAWETLAPPGRNGAAAWPPQATVDLVSALDTRPGTLRVTGRATDVAIAGEGYFVVETEQGELYTRDGSFHVDAAGRLVSAEGDPVLGSGGPLQIGSGSPTIHEDGSIAADGSVVGRLRLVEFPAAQRLEHRGRSLLAAPADQAAQDLPPERIRVVQGQLETSNVNPVDTLVDLIAAQRSFEIASRVIEADDQLLEKSVNELPRVR
jgi:flagellar basal-body rod protein FlgG